MFTGQASKRTLPKPWNGKLRLPSKDMQGHNAILEFAMNMEQALRETLPKP